MLSRLLRITENHACEVEARLLPASIPWLTRSKPLKLFFFETLANDFVIIGRYVMLKQ